MPNFNHEELNGLLAQLSCYSEKPNQRQIDANFAELHLGGTETLYRKLNRYEERYAEKVGKFCQNHYLIQDERLQISIEGGQFFRQQLLHFLAERSNQIREFSGNLEQRYALPSKATISMEQLLGKAGVRLYQLALEEEINSKEYLNAVFRASTTHYEGEKWAERPVIIVAGPSGCGKSYSTQVAIDKAKQFLPKQDDDLSGNKIVTVDGGIFRATSQLYKLMIQLANNKGYTGVSDLSAKSNMLDKVKLSLLQAVLKVSSLGIAIPETFSGYLKPFNSKLRSLERLIKLPNSRILFCRVDGERKSLFKKIVAFLGERRAWKRSSFVVRPYDLNRTDLCESKAYQGAYFDLGDRGSKHAQQWFSKHSPNNLNMIVSNDLLLKKEEPQGSNQWVDANSNEKGVVLVSAGAFRKWEEIQTHLSAQERQNPLLSFPDFVRNLPMEPMVRTSGELDFAVSAERLRKKLVHLAKEVTKKEEKYHSNDPRMRLLHEKQQVLTKVKDVILPFFNSKKDIEPLREHIELAIVSLKASGQWGYFSESRKILKSMLSSMDKMNSEWSLAEPRNVNAFFQPAPKGEKNQPVPNHSPEPQQF